MISTFDVHVWVEILYTPSRITIQQCLAKIFPFALSLSRFVFCFTLNRRPINKPHHLHHPSTEGPPNLAQQEQDQAVKMGPRNSLDYFLYILFAQDPVSWGAIELKPVRLYGPSLLLMQMDSSVEAV